ncbi:hypothetical protein PtB15_11B250 [Puccinia triticina]|nr:hypothetical protein PtB15_11B250 [Puccinia triticina]
MDDIPWATEHAEHAQAYYERQAAAAQSAQPREPRVGRTNPYENKGTPNEERGSSREEQLLSLLLSVNTELVNAFQQYDEVESLARAERELQEAKELLKHQAGRPRIQASSRSAMARVLSIPVGSWHRFGSPP